MSASGGCNTLKLVVYIVFGQAVLFHLTASCVLASNSGDAHHQAIDLFRCPPHFSTSSVVSNLYSSHLNRLLLPVNNLHPPSSWLVVFWEPTNSSTPSPVCMGALVSTTSILTARECGDLVENRRLKACLTTPSIDQKHRRQNRHGDTVPHLVIRFSVMELELGERIDYYNKYDHPVQDEVNNVGLGRRDEAESDIHPSHTGIGLNTPTIFPISSIHLRSSHNNTKPYPRLHPIKISHPADQVRRPDSTIFDKYQIFSFSHHHQHQQHLDNNGIMKLELDTHDLDPLNCTSVALAEYLAQEMQTASELTGVDMPMQVLGLAPLLGLSQNQLISAAISTRSTLFAVREITNAAGSSSSFSSSSSPLLSLSSSTLSSSPSIFSQQELVEFNRQMIEFTRPDNTFDPALLQQPPPSPSPPLLPPLLADIDSSSRQEIDEIMKEVCGDCICANRPRSSSSSPALGTPLLHQHLSASRFRGFGSTSRGQRRRRGGGGGEEEEDGSFTRLRGLFVGEIPQDAGINLVVRNGLVFLDVAVYSDWIERIIKQNDHVKYPNGFHSELEDEEGEDQLVAARSVSRKRKREGFLDNQVGR